MPGRIELIVCGQFAGLLFERRGVAGSLGGGDRSTQAIEDCLDLRFLSWGTLSN